MSLLAFFDPICFLSVPLREQLLQSWPELNKMMLSLAKHADRETQVFANMALSFLVTPAANKLSLKEAGLLDFLRDHLKSNDPELVHHASNIMSNWAFELPVEAQIKFTAEQKEMLRNSLMQTSEVYVSSGLHEAAFLGAWQTQSLE